MKHFKAYYTAFLFLALPAYTLASLSERALLVRVMAFNLDSVFTTLDKLSKLQVPNVPNPPTLDSSSVDLGEVPWGTQGSALDPNKLSNYTKINPYLTPNGYASFKQNPLGFKLNFQSLMKSNPSDAQLAKLIRNPAAVAATTTTTRIVTVTKTTTLITRVSASVTINPVLLSSARSMLSTVLAANPTSTSILQDAIYDNLEHIQEVLSALKTATAPRSTPSKVIKMTFPSNEVWPRRTVTMTVRNLPTAK